MLRKIGFSLRTLILFIIVGLIPLVIAFVIALNTQLRLGSSVSDEASLALEQLFKDLVAEQATGMAQNVALYLDDVQQSKTGGASAAAFSVAKNATSLDSQAFSALLADDGLSSRLSLTFSGSGSFILFDFDGKVIYHPDLTLVGQTLESISEIKGEAQLRTLVNLVARGETVQDGIYEWAPGAGAEQLTIPWYIVLVRVPGYPLVVGASILQSELVGPALAADARLQREVGDTRLATAFYFLLVTVAAVGAAVWFSNRLTSPIRWAGDTARRVFGMIQNITGVGVETHELGTAPVASPQPATETDEIGWITQAIAATDTLIREEVGALEKQVRLRTGELEQRAGQMEAIANITHETADILEIDTLLSRSVRLISENFGYYHAAIYLMGDARSSTAAAAQLQAASSEGGRRLLAAGYTLDIGQSTLLQQVLLREAPLVYQDMDPGASVLMTTDLANSRSGIVLPMHARGHMIGFLDVQSTTPRAFGEDQMRIMRVLSDQIGLALENTRLFEESQRVIQEMGNVYGQRVVQAWQRRLSQGGFGFRYDGLRIRPLAPHELENATTQIVETLAPSTARLSTEPTTPVSAVGAVPSASPAVPSGSGPDLCIPLKWQQETIGKIIVKPPAPYSATTWSWTTTEQELIQELSTQISQALENARLVEEIQSYAEQERQISQVTSRVQGSLDLNTLLQTAVRELAGLPNVSEVAIVLGEAPSGKVLAGNSPVAGNSPGLTRSPGSETLSNLTSTPGSVYPKESKE